MSARIVKSGKCFDKFLEELGGLPGMTANEALKVGSTAQETVQKISDQFEKIYPTKGYLGKKAFTLLPKPTNRTVPVGDTGLIYGKVQSGKTNVSVAATALALSNNFKLCIVLTSDNVWLAEQTYERFAEGLRYDGPTMSFCQDWKDDPKAMGQRLFRDCTGDGLVLVTTKNAKHLNNLLQLLNGAEFDRIPTLIIDDEADNASLNTFANKLPQSVSSINNAIGKIRERAFYSIYLQVTATPQSLLLQGTGHPWQPQFFIKLDPGVNYMGGDLFFGQKIPLDETVANAIPTKYVEFVPQNEIDKLNSKGEIVPSLQLAMCVFLLGFASQMNKGAKRSSGDVFSFLIHTSSKQGSHILAQSAIRGFLDDVRKALKGLAKSSDRLSKKEAYALLEQARKILVKTYPMIPGLQVLVNNLLPHLNAGIGL